MHGQLGLGDKNDRHTTESQQPPSNVFNFFLQHSTIFLADCELKEECGAVGRITVGN